MRRLALAFASGLFAGGAAAAAECPQQIGDAGFTALAKDLAAEPTCKAAVARLRDCAWGSSADTEFSPIVVKICEATFFDRLSPAGQRNYGKRMQMCAYEYAHQDGTVHMSEAALCQAGVAAAFAADPSVAETPVKASFDCAAAKTVLERAICTDDTLGEADMILSDNYKGALKGADAKTRPGLVESQRRWHAGLGAICQLDKKAAATAAAVACLTHQFEARFTAFDTCGDAGDPTPACLDARDGNEPPPGPRASFDCQTPATPLEIVICADASLGQDDIKLSQTYHAADAKLGPAAHAGLVASERQWLRFVARACPLGAVGGIPPLIARSCVGAAFRTRVGQLETCPGKPDAERISCLDKFGVLPAK